MVTHSTSRGLGWKTTSLSFVAFERSIEAELDSPGNRSKFLVRTQKPSGRTVLFPINIEGFEGLRTPLHQRRCQRNFLGRARQSELSEVDTSREGQQLMGDIFRPTCQREPKGSGKYR
jgi:hypothetical protein